MMILRQMLLPIVASFGVAALAANPLIRLLRQLNSRQSVSQYAPDSHQSKQGTLTMGGLIILSGVLAGLATMALMPGARGQIEWRIALLAFGFGLIGFLDDFVVPRAVKGKRGLGWKQKLAMQAAFATPAVWPNGGVADWPTIGAGVFILLFFSNAYNFADGLDALAGQIVLLLCIGISVLSAIVFGWNDWMTAALVLAAAVPPFLKLNWPPARVFMGDVGALPIGAIVGFLVFDIGRKAPGMASGALIVMSLLLIAELVPVPMQLFWVKAFKRRLFKSTPIHHAFEASGWPERKIMNSFVATQAALVGVAVLLAWALAPRGAQ